MLTQPCKVNGNFFSKVFSNVVQWLVFVPFGPVGPVVEQDLPLVQLFRQKLMFWSVKWTLEIERKLESRRQKFKIIVEQEREDYASDLMKWERRSESPLVQQPCHAHLGPLSLAIGCAR